MHVLVVEPDRHLAGIMSELFAADGFSILVAADATGGVGAVMGARPDVAVVSLELPGSDGLEVVRALRRREGGATGAVVVLVAERVDAALRSRAAGLGVQHLLTRPVSLLDLGELVRAAPPLPGARADRPAFHPGNAALLATLWVQRATGVLRVEQPGSSAWVLFSGGGPVGTDGKQAVRAALQGGRVELEPCPVDGPGDRDGLASTLWSATREWALAAHAPVREDLLVRPSRRTADASGLPLRPALRGILRGLDGPSLLSQVAEAMNEPVEGVAVELEALTTLGFLSLHPNAEARPTATASAPRARRPLSPFAVDRFTDVSDIVLEPRQRSAPAAPDPTPNAPPARPRPSLGPSPSRSAPPPPPPRPPPTRTVDIWDSDTTDPVIGRRPADPSSTTHTDPGGPRSRAGIRSIPPILERSLRRTSAADLLGPGGREQAPERVDAVQLLHRLRREADLVRSADPWTVLGVPRDADSSLIDRAAARMEARYAPLTTGTDPEVAHLAATIAQRVKAALKAARTHEARHPTSPEVAAITAGRRATALERWEEADVAFSKARELLPDSPEALAGLGWARFHNPTVPVAEREEDGLAFLELAVQFSPTYVAGWWQLASACHLSGRTEAALTHARRVLRLAPDHPDAAGLIRRLGG